MKRFVSFLSMVWAIILLAHSAWVVNEPPYWSSYDGDIRLISGSTPQDLQYRYVGADSTRLVVLNFAFGEEMDCECPLYESKGESVLTVPSHIKVLNVDADVVALDKMCFEYSDFDKIVLPETLQFIGMGAFSMTSLTEIELGKNLQTIGGGSFYGNKYLESITLPDKLWSIGDNSFVANGFKEVKFGRSLYYIGGNSFSYNDNLTEITLPEGLYDLGENCFNNCANLSTVTIPGFLRISSCFNNCPNIKTIVLKSEYPPRGWESFNDVDKEECQLIVPKDALDEYKAHYFWKQFKNITASDESSSETTDVSALPSECNDMKYYNLDGTLINGGDLTSSGIVIEVNNGKVMKILK